MKVYAVVDYTFFNVGEVLKLFVSNDLARAEISRLNDLYKAAYFGDKFYVVEYEILGFKENNLKKDLTS